MLFDYDDVDRLSLTTLPNGVAVGHTCDNADQLTGLAWQKAGQASTGNIGYCYNSLGQIVGQTGGFSSQALPAASTGASGFDDANRQLSYNSQALTYEDKVQALPSTARAAPKRLRANIRFIYDTYIESNRSHHGHRQYRRRPARPTAPCVHGE
ncbi:hypothetical protein BI312_10175 [Xanthomonas citri pv. citri]|uniref:Uncharacterized protein n=1 Tax=Xanthomonas axonopodis pv. citri (strain 306) TaxID=190486 RepID=A0AAI7ZI98_XANAC|nr:hypothetical protein XAC3784 [Xanthomonas citri pv. citri str. 306]AGH79246.1 hypothetical protein XAC29_19235 [Xanthomonas axonopodis Xac29-1]APR09587.1 hypothetical protein BI314_04695 [Xanthomonas citri pv. citri]QYF46711.1 hypothetical protein HZS93_04069 [Xanthomonas citri]CEJ47899.1 conserved hypothetical protein [Xanthomonas citri pv. bilvae]